MEGSGTLMDRPIVRGENHSSLPERLVILFILLGVLASYDEINEFVQSTSGVASEILTIFLLIIMVPLLSDWLFRVISSITGMK
ncbi:MAG: hypothetical protein CMA26_04080 [Euryarchaeota archaeon]|nr:hypothetical protein [Euryarchaeota archaeon]|tara:strand:- start:211 stop:462 length:252 start_codon:yes stop_codon:yes gene_type:complete